MSVDPSDRKSGDAPPCPICCGKIDIVGDVPLYGIAVCKPCQYGYCSRRQLAGIFDFVAVLILLVSVDLFTYRVGPRWLQNSPSSWSLILLSAVVLFGLRDGVSGYSPGKLLFGLRVVNVETGTPIGIARSLRRNLPVMIVLALPSALLATVLFPIAAMVGFALFVGIGASVLKGERVGDGYARTKVIWRKHSHSPVFDLNRGRCAKCAYDLRGSVSRVCPECGMPMFAFQPEARGAPPNSP